MLAGLRGHPTRLARPPVKIDRRGGQERGPVAVRHRDQATRRLDLRIGQLVDAPNVGVSAVLPLDIFDLR